MTMTKIVTHYVGMYNINMTDRDSFLEEYKKNNSYNPSQWENIFVPQYYDKNTRLVFIVLNHDTGILTSSENTFRGVG